MTTHEQHTITGEVEITDSKTMKVIARKITLTAERPCSLCFRHFTTGDQIEVTFPAHCDLWNKCGAGPWQPRGHTSQWIRRNASQIYKVNGNRLIYSAEHSEGLIPKAKLLYIMAEMIGERYDPPLSPIKEIWSYYRRLKAKILKTVPEQRVKDFLSQLDGLQIEDVEDWYEKEKTTADLSDMPGKR